MPFVREQSGGTYVGSINITFNGDTSDLKWSLSYLDSNGSWHTIYSQQRIGNTYNWNKTVDLSQYEQ